MSDHAASISFRSAGATHVGCVRSLNEDAFIEDAAAGLWAVADGLGGAAAGDHASQVVVAALGGVGRRPSVDELLAAVRDRLHAANAELRAYAANERIQYVAATVATLLCFSQQYVALWAGDSRVYQLRNCRLTVVTRDHSVVQELVDAGVISWEEAQRHPSRNLITRAVGAADALEVELVQNRIEPGDVYLLCSDGLTKVVSDDEIGAAMMGTSLEAATTQLIELGLSRGAPDNITVVVVACA
jgi:serine/threonine protein phosphatase Stp1